MPKTLIDLPGMRLKVAIASDIHAASTAQQVTALRRFIREAHEVHGVKDVFVPGDVTAGMGVYRGQIHDLYAHSADAQRRAANATLPRYAGLRYYMIGGNHDAVTSERRYNIVQHLCQERDDCVYLGYDMRTCRSPTVATFTLAPLRRRALRPELSPPEGPGAVQRRRDRVRHHRGSAPNLRLVFSGHARQMSIV